jgi:hypothetical protein
MWQLLPQLEPQLCVISELLVHTYSFCKHNVEAKPKHEKSREKKKKRKLSLKKEMGGRTVYSVGMRPLASWDFGFKSRRSMDISLSAACFREEVFASPPEESYRTCVCVCVSLCVIKGKNNRLSTMRNYTEVKKGRKKESKNTIRRQ